MYRPRKVLHGSSRGYYRGSGTIELRCTEPTGFGFGSPAELEVTVELNTRITSVIDDDRVVAGLSYTDLSGTGVTDADFAGAKLSEDGTTITWEITSADVNLGTTGADGFQVTIGGIKANASAVEMVKISPRWFVLEARRFTAGRSNSRT